MEGFDQLHIDGTNYATRLTRKYRERRPYVPRDQGEVRAIIPGVILELLVKPGARVARGAGLLVIEAMKMQNVVTAPREGHVERVLVEVGQSVPKGTVLVTFE